MSDANDRLYHIAEAQAEYFTARQAVDAGMDRATLRHHPNGRYERVQWGLSELAPGQGSMRTTVIQGTAGYVTHISGGVGWRGHEIPSYPD